VNDLVVWLRRQIDEDERQSPDVHLLRCEKLLSTWPSAADKICNCGLPARVLREVEAKRRIIELHPLVTYTDEEPGYRQILNDHTCPGRQAPCTTLRLLALPYADRPGYRQEWRP
jgi:hypothetical protein